MGYSTGSKGRISNSLLYEGFSAGHWLLVTHEPVQKRVSRSRKIDRNWVAGVQGLWKGMCTSHNIVSATERELWKQTWRPEGPGTECPKSSKNVKWAMYQEWKRKGRKEIVIGFGNQNNDENEKSYRYDLKIVVMSYAPPSPTYHSQAYYMPLLPWLKSCPLGQAPRVLPPSPTGQLHETWKM